MANRRLATYQRVWRIRWVVRGIPRLVTFWTPLDGQALIAGLATWVLVWVLLRQVFGLDMLGFFPLLIWFGAPVGTYYAVTHNRMGGKRIDSWASAQLSYWTSPKTWDRGRPVDPAPRVIDWSRVKVRVTYRQR